MRQARAAAARAEARALRTWHVAGRPIGQRGHVQRRMDVRRQAVGREERDAAARLAFVQARAIGNQQAVLVGVDAAQAIDGSGHAGARLQNAERDQLGRLAEANALGRQFPAVGALDERDPLAAQANRGGEDDSFEVHLNLASHM